MNIYKCLGGCHCGNIGLEIKVTNEPDSFNPRACDCDFCTKHGASYISDNNGELTIHLLNASQLNKYRHGNKIADFLICQICGVLVCACYEDRGHLYATVNSKAIAQNNHFGIETVVSPKLLSSEEKTQRWKDVWFSKVKIEHG